ncbi:MAG TPA: hypothetical protein PKE45_05830, partial [Caldilineaceae bacterium]|nr:hypothetical protein [Caldilineaceae bacterium]
MVNDPRSSDANTEGSRVDIGEIEGGIHNSTIAGRDVNQTNIAGNAETGGGDFVGHDKHVQGDEVHGDQNVVQVGGNAQNVAAGKNIIQIGSIKVSLYLAVLIAVCMIGIILSLFFVARRLAIIGSAMTAPTATPTFTPTPLPIPTPTYMPMSGAVYGIAIAQFGQLDAQGHIQQTQEASNLSQMLADSLQHAFEAAGTDGE